MKIDELKKFVKNNIEHLEKSEIKSLLVWDFIIVLKRINYKTNKLKDQVKILEEMYEWILNDIKVYNIDKSDNSSINYHKSLSLLTF